MKALKPERCLELFSLLPPPTPPKGIYDLVEHFFGLSDGRNTIYCVYIAAKQLIAVGQDYNFFQHM